MALQRVHPVARRQVLALALFLLVPVVARAQASWIVNFPPERVLHWQPRTAAEFAHPEALFDGRTGARSAANQLTAPPSTPLDATWSEAGPPGRAGHLLVYDSRRHRMLLVGGITSQDRVPWVWSCSLPEGDWTKLAPLPWPSSGAPGGLTAAAAAYDSVHDRLIVMPSTSPLRIEALALDGSLAWTPLWTAPSESYRLTALAIDSRRDALALIGPGDAAGITRWLTRIPLANPAAWTSEVTQGGQFAAPSTGAAVYDAARDVFDVLLRYDNSAENLSVGSWSVQELGAGLSPAWTALPVPDMPPTAQWGSDAAVTLSLDDARGRLLLVSQTGAAMAYSVADGTAQWLTSAVGPIAYRYAPAAAFDPVARRLYVNGGSAGAMSTMARAVDPAFVAACVDSGVPWATGLPAPGTTASWQRIGGASPGSRWLHSMLLDPAGGQLVLFGGYGVPNILVRPLSGVGGWRELQDVSGPVPSARSFGARAVDPRRDVLLTYGGQADSGGVVSDLWELPLYPGGENRPLHYDGAGPGTLRNAAFIWDAPRSRFLLVGGDNLDTQLHTAWELRLEPSPAWRQLGLRGRVPPYQVLFPDSARGDAWCVSYWHYESRLRHVAISDDSLVYEEVQSTGANYEQMASAYFVGFDAAHHRFLWAWDPTGGYSVPLTLMWITQLGESTADWQLRSVVSPGVGWRGFMALAYDPSSSRLWLDAGQQDNGVYFADTWTLQFPFDFPTAALASLSGSASDASGVTLRWDVGAPAGTPCAVERSTDAVAWEAAGTAEWIGANEVRFAGAPIKRGARSAFRLRIAASGGDVLSAIAWLVAPAGHAQLAIASVSNPCRGAPAVRLELAPGAPARLRVLDVSGRMIADGSVPVGTQRWTSATRVPPGLYFAQVEQLGDRRVTRLIVAP